MSTKPTFLADVLFGQTRARVLDLLYGHQGESFYVRQIARQIGTSVGAVQRELEKLAHVGLIIRSELGNQVFYRANRDSAVFAELKVLVEKTVGAVHVVRTALEPLSDKIVLSFIYGSVARHDDRAGSDVDVMVVGDASLDEVVAKLTDAEKRLGREVNPTVYSEQEFRTKIAGGNHFLNAVIRGEKIFLKGDEHELGKVAGVRLAEAGSLQPR